MNETLELKSGNHAELSPASFAAASDLRRVLARELAGTTFNFSGDLGALMAKDVSAIMNVICQLVASEAVEKGVFKCLERCLYNGQKITRDTFEKPESWPDFLPIAVEVVKMNVLPFFSGLNLSLSEPAKAPTADRK